MTVLVTGGAGYIGSHMVLELLDAGEKPVVLDDLSTGFRWAVPEGVPLVVGDFGDEDLVTENRRAIRRRRDHPLRREDRGCRSRSPIRSAIISTTPPRRAICWRPRRGCEIKRFIFSSTAAVYGDPSRNPVTEDEPLKPLSPYAAPS